MSVMIGCSGWSYDDWIERFYPFNLAEKRSEWLQYYAKFFPTVEINSTFYRVPTDETVKGWVEKAAKIGKFEYSIKMPQVVTHETIVEGSAEKAGAQAASFEKLCVEPLAAGGCLGSVLIQLHPKFSLERKDAMLKLRSVMEIVNCDSYKYAIEFRNKSWLNEAKTDLKADVLDLLREFKMANVISDGPAMPITRSLTAKHAYVRFHGRNFDIWWKKDDKEKPEAAEGERPDEAWQSQDIEEDDYRINRYDYLYSDNQLDLWRPRIEELMQNAEEVRVYFNNHGGAKAVKNALYMMDLLKIPHEKKEIAIQDQMKIGEYV